jgi:hypothetical protein
MFGGCSKFGQKFLDHFEKFINRNLYREINCAIPEGCQQLTETIGLMKKKTTMFRDHLILEN